MPKLQDYGGQRRTIVSQCGFSCRGSLREADYKLRLHMRLCPQCNDKEYESPAFNYDTANSFNLHKLGNYYKEPTVKVTYGGILFDIKQKDFEEGNVPTILKKN